MNEQDEVAAEVFDRSAAVGKVMRCVTHLYVGHVNSSLPNNVLYTKDKNFGEMRHVRTARCKASKTV